MAYAYPGSQFTAHLCPVRNFWQTHEERGNERRIQVYSQQMKRSTFPATTALPLGMRAVGIFLLFGALMASLAGTTLVWRGTVFARIWTLNPRAYKELLPFAKVPGILFLLLSIALLIAAWGWFKRHLWGWRLSVVLIGTQVLGNLVNMSMGNFIEGAIGITIAGALLFYLTRAKVRSFFERQPSLE